MGSASIALVGGEHLIWDSFVLPKTTRESNEERALSMAITSTPAQSSDALEKKRFHAVATPLSALMHQMQLEKNPAMLALLLLLLGVQLLHLTKEERNADARQREQLLERFVANVGKIVEKYRDSGSGILSSGIIAGGLGIGSGVCGILSVVRDNQAFIGIGQGLAGAGQISKSTGDGVNQFTEGSRQELQALQTCLEHKMRDLTTQYDAAHTDYKEVLKYLEELIQIVRSILNKTVAV